MSQQRDESAVPIVRVPGMRALVWTSVLGFAGYALLLRRRPSGPPTAARTRAVRAS